MKMYVNIYMIFTMLSFSLVRTLTDSTALSVVHLSPLGSQTSFSAANQNRIENVTDWEAIAKKYRALMGDEESSSLKDSDAESSSVEGGTAPAAPPAQVGNNITLEPNV